MKVAPQTLHMCGKFVYTKLLMFTHSYECILHMNTIVFTLQENLLTLR